MPKITLDKKRLLKDIGKHLDDDTLRDRISFLGTDLESLDADQIVVEIFPNRPDLLSTEGFTRAMKHFLGIKKGIDHPEIKKSDYEVNIEKEVKSVRPYTACLVAKNLRLDEENIKDLIEVQEKLHITYGRNRKKCAIGIYPLEKIKFPITYTAKDKKEISFRPLKSKKIMASQEILEKYDAGKKYGHLLVNKNKFPLFVDAAGSILSMPPIINSAKTGEVTAKTKELFVECSGSDFSTLSKAVNMLCYVLYEMGADIYEVSLNYGLEKKKTPDLKRDIYEVGIEEVNSIIGLDLGKKDVSTALGRMGYSCIEREDSLIVEVPPYRTDILHFVDIVEDIAIGHGYEKIGFDNSQEYSVGRESFSEVVKGKIRDVLIGCGALEVYNYSLVDGYMQKKVFPEKREFLIYTENSVSEHYNSLRLSVLGSLLDTLKKNKKNEYPQKIFEVGRVFSRDPKEDTMVRENDVLGAAFAVEKGSFTVAKQNLDAIFDSLNLKYSLDEKEIFLFMKGKVGRVMCDGVAVGFLGEVNPEVLEAYDLQFPVSLFEINLDVLLGKESRP